MKIRKYINIFIGIILVALAISVFYTPNKIVSGGVSGVSTILYHTLGVEPGLSYAVINISLLIIAFKWLGKEFVITTVAGSMLLSLLVQIFSYIPPLTNDVLLASIFGAIIYGIGIGMALAEGASTGGTDILSRLVQRFFPHVKIGSLLMVVDAVVIGASLMVFKNVTLALYGIVALFIASFSINWLIGKLNVSKLAFVVTEKGVDVSQALVTYSPRGVTIFDAIGAYTMEEKNVLMCALKEHETEKFQKRILEIDPGAFIIFSESQQIIGNGFRVYK